MEGFGGGFGFGPGYLKIADQVGHDGMSHKIADQVGNDGRRCRIRSAMTEKDGLTCKPPCLSSNGK